MKILTAGAAVNLKDEIAEMNRVRFGPDPDAWPANDRKSLMTLTRCVDALVAIEAEVEVLRQWTVENPDVLTRIIAVLEHHDFHDEEWCDGPDDLVQEVIAVCKLAKGEVPETAVPKIICGYCGRVIYVVGGPSTSTWESNGVPCTNSVGHWPKGQGWEGRPSAHEGRAS